MVRHPTAAQVPIVGAAAGRQRAAEHRAVPVLDDARPMASHVDLPVGHPAMTTVPIDPAARRHRRGRLDPMVRVPIAVPTVLGVRPPAHVTAVLLAARMLQPPTAR